MIKLLAYQGNSQNESTGGDDDNSFESLARCQKMSWGPMVKELMITKGVSLAVTLVAVDLAVLQRHSLIDGGPHCVQEGDLSASRGILPHLHHASLLTLKVAPCRQQLVCFLHGASVQDDQASEVATLADCSSSFLC